MSLPPLPAGSYELYADVTQESGFAQTLTSRVEIPAELAAPPGSEALLAADPDDSWHRDGPSPEGAARGLATAPLSGGLTMTWDREGPLRADQEGSLWFSVLGPDGKPATLEPYMGMLGHAAVRRQDGAVFAHLHPVGTISMASAALFAKRELPGGPGKAGEDHRGHSMDHAEHAGHPEAAAAAGRVSFPYAFPSPGQNRLWVQVKSAEQVLTGVFDAPVEPATRGVSGTFR